MIDSEPMKNDIIHIKNTISSFVLFEQSISLKYIEEEKLTYRGIINGIQPLQKAWEKEQEEKNLAFNVFNIMSYGHYETRLHTPFLWNLLNPEGTHQKGRFFLDEFIDIVFNGGINTKEIKKIDVRQEHSTKGFGQIDIYIQFKYQGKRHQIAIENKINHHDEPKQLKRYWDFMNTKSKDNNYLIYLNKYGHFPSMYNEEKEAENELNSIPAALFNKLYKEEHCIILSYKRDITNWLETCKKSLPENRLLYTINQYLEIIKFK